ncbi:MAG: WYL domain-containing protein [Anaerolineae bacterium]
MSNPNLEACLTAMPIRHLWAIARCHDIPCDHALRKVQVVDKLAAELRRPGVIGTALERLSDAERQALDALVAAGGRIPWPTFREQFGEIRPHRPWQDDAPREPWRNPISPAETLWFLGLVYRLPRRPRSGQTVYALIPSDLLTLLPAPEGPAIPEPVASTVSERPQRQPQMDTDVALLISLLHREDIRPLWGRWLPPRHLGDLNERLSVSEDVSQARSELQTGRLRFIHALAEAAGLVGLSGQWLKPTPRAWAWLRLTPADRYEMLWTAWRDGSEATQALRQSPSTGSGGTSGQAVWDHFRLPGHDSEVALDVLELVLDGLSRLAVGSRYPLGPFVASLVEAAPVLSSLPPVWRDDQVHDWGSEIVSELVLGPLSWWGVVSITDEGQEPAFSLSPLGDWLLTGQGAGPAGPAKSFRVEPDLTIRMPEPPDLQDLVRVESMAEWRGWLDGRRGYQVTPGSLSRALPRGMALPEAMETLARGEGGLGAVPHALLEAWAAETEAVVLRRVTLLETRELERMQALSANRAIRRHFRETLSPRAVVVDGARVDHLVRTLKRQGVYPRVDVPPAAKASAASQPLSDSGAAQLWVAGQVYARLSRWIDLPQPMPVAVLDDLAAQMDEAMHAVARQAADDATQRLADAMDGWARFPMPEAGLSPEEAVPVIEQAIEEGDTLRLTYWTAGRGESSTRTVEPYRIEWRGDVPYLIGYCHERLAQRVFRVDRMQSIGLSVD